MHVDYPFCLINTLLYRISILFLRKFIVNKFNNFPRISTIIASIVVKLALQLHIMRSSDLESGIKAIASDRIQGASELARQGLRLCADWCRSAPSESPKNFKKNLLDLGDRIARCRPSMAPIHNMAWSWRDRVAPLREHDTEDLRREAAEIAMGLIRASEQATREAAKQAQNIIGSHQTLFTHSFSSTVLETFKFGRLRNVQAIISEGRPQCEGYKLAQQLSAWSIPVTLITDAQSGYFVGKADAVLVGADSLLPDGSVVNKAGTYVLALAAQAQRVPFYVCCESFKQRRDTTSPTELEEMEPEALGAPSIEGVQIRNIYFDVTPSHLVTAWIDEHGIRFRETPPQPSAFRASGRA